MIKKKFDQTTHCPSNSNKIHSIGVVGGFNDFENDPQSNDYRFVMPALDYLKQSGFDVSDTPDFDAINFEDNRNFLTEHQNYDTIFISHIPNGRNLPWTRMAFNHYSSNTDTSDRRKLANTISDKNSPEDWCRRIILSQANILVTLGTYIEVEHNYLLQAASFDQVPLILPSNKPNLVGVGEKFGRSDIRKIYDEELDIPFQWLGISAKRDFLKMNEAKILAGKTDLSQKVQSVLSPVSKYQRRLAI